MNAFKQFAFQTLERLTDIGRPGADAFGWFRPVSPFKRYADPRVPRVKRTRPYRVKPALMWGAVCLVAMAAATVTASAVDFGLGVNFGVANAPGSSEGGNHFATVLNANWRVAQPIILHAYWGFTGPGAAPDDPEQRDTVNFLAAVVSVNSRALWNDMQGGYIKTGVGLYNPRPHWGSGGLRDGPISSGFLVGPGYQWLSGEPGTIRFEALYHVLPTDQPNFYTITLGLNLGF